MDTPLPHHAGCVSYTSDVFPVGRPRADSKERAPGFERKTNLSNAAIGSSPSQAERNPTMTTMPEERRRKRRKRRKRADNTPSVSLSTASPEVSPSLPSSWATDRHGTVSTLLSGSVFDFYDGDISSSSTDTESLRHGRSPSLLLDSCLRAKRSYSGYINANPMVGDVLSDCEHIGKERSAKETSPQKHTRFNELLQAACEAHIADFESTAGERSPFALGSPYYLDKFGYSPSDSPAWLTSAAQIRKRQLAESHAKAFADHCDHGIPPTIRLEDCVVLPAVRPEDVTLKYDEADE